MGTSLFTDTFCSIVELLEALGIRQIHRWTQCWTHEFDGWLIALNGGTDVVDVPLEEQAAPFAVSPGHILIAYRGEPMAYCTPFSEPEGSRFAELRETFDVALAGAIARAQGL
jgi:hypothetical protein